METTAEGMSACGRPWPAAPEQGIESPRLDLSLRAVASGSLGRSVESPEKAIDI